VYRLPKLVAKFVSTMIMAGNGNFSPPVNIGDTSVMDRMPLLGPRSPYPEVSQC
jgi:hypothetical protein